MSDYNLNGLNPRDFEHLTQALAMKLIGPGVMPFGDGPDGGREATFTGKMPYPSQAEAWQGYLVIQCKFLTRPSGVPRRDGDWALKQLKADLDKFTDAKRKLDKPDYYLFVTNAVLTPVAKMGAKDKALALLKSYQKKLKLKGYDVWDYDKLCRLLDGQPEICQKYVCFITVGDVLAKVIEMLDGARPEFEQVMTRFLQDELRGDQFVKLEQAGHSADQKTALAHVFVDLPTADHSLTEPPEDKEKNPDKLPPGFVAEVLEAGARVLKGSVAQQSDLPRRGLNIPGSPQPGRFVVVGGPGQGKSTLGQFICQLHRAAILKDRPAHLLSVEAQTTLDLIQQQCRACGVELPTARRFPVRVVLDQFASDLATGKVNSLLTYLLRRIKTLTDYDCTVADLRRWLRAYPWLIVLDGLDEVPPTSNRTETLGKIADFWAEVATLDADVLVIATTRPQGYNDDFSPQLYQHHYLTPLSKARATHYAQRLAVARFGAEPDRKAKVLQRLATALEQPTTARLMTTPLQVTIMATLVDQVGQPPQERWRLFQQYYEVIYRREMERGVSPILQQRQTDINVIHNRVGLLLQTQSEQAGATESRLSAERFRRLVRARLMEEGFEDVELETRVEEITDAAVKRLVFLVGLEDDRIGFEIRSLQEFTAAEALMDGGDEQVRKRLEVIAPSAHWRNVFLFAAGKCFAVRQFLRDTIIGICADLNDEENDRLAGTTLTGSRLALDILADGVAREQPNFARRLADLALRLMELPDTEINRRLAGIYNHTLDAKFREQITQQLGQQEFIQKVGAWVVLLELLAAGVSWAENLLDKNWPIETKQQLELLTRCRDLALKPILSKLVELIPSISPEDFFPYLHSRLSRQILEQQKRSDLPSWFYSCFGAAHQVLMPFVLQDSPPLYNNPQLRQNSLHNPDLIALADLPLVNSDWAPFLSCGRFAKQPTATTLANELRWLSEVWNPKEPNWPLHFLISWPLSACLFACKTRDDLKRLANRVKAGELGQFDDWQAAEKRWEKEGVTERDILYMTDERWPFDASIAEIGGVLASGSYEFGRHALYSELLKYLDNLPFVSQAGLRLSTLILESHIFGFSFSGEAVAFELPPLRLKQLFEQSQATRFSIDLLRRCTPQTQLGEDWIEFLEWAGGKYPSPLIIQRRDWQHTKQVVQAYLDNPARKGLLNVLTMLALAGNQISIPAHLLSEEGLGTDEQRRNAILLRLAQGDFDKTEVEKLAANYVHLSVETPTIWLALMMFDFQPVESQAKESFALALRNHLDPSRINECSRVTEFLVELMRKRTSTIADATKWEECGLPVLL